MGVDRATASAALAAFPGLPHRLQVVAERDGVRYVNDSKCTTPAGAIVALEAFEPGRCIVIVGGSDKGAAYDVLAEALVARAKGVIGIGATGPAMLSAAAKRRTADRPILHVATHLPAAVELARSWASPGDVVLLSPACASYDQFDNYEQRGEAYVALVRG